MSTRRFPRVLVQRRLEKTHITGMTGWPCLHSLYTPYLSGRRDRSAYRYALATFSAGKRVAPALGIHTRSLHHDRLRRIFSPPGFWLVVTYIREQCCFFEGRSPRIRVTLRLARGCGWTALRLVTVMIQPRRCWFARRGSSISCATTF